ncbi:hypothetical protein LB505_005094 [Fusarium chuoi]|nr:hypothetical protein LB505_005094 [Fusarium chuoi]
MYYCLAKTSTPLESRPRDWSARLEHDSRQCPISRNQGGLCASQEHRPYLYHPHFRHHWNPKGCTPRCWWSRCRSAPVHKLPVQHSRTWVCFFYGIGYWLDRRSLVHHLRPTPHGSCNCLVRGQTRRHP